MSVLGRMLAPRASIASSHDLYLELLRRGHESASGAVVTSMTAMQSAAVYACVRVLSETVGQVPLLLYERLTEGGKRRATEHWAYRLLHERPNAWQTPFEFKEMLQAHIALRGNAYALKTVVRGEVRELLPLPPERVEVQRPVLADPWTVAYAVRMPDGSVLPVPRERMLHLPGLAFDGVVGHSPIQLQRDTIGSALQLMRHGARLFKHGAELGVILSHPGPKLSEDARDRLLESFDEKYRGAENAHKTILLEEGTKVEKVGMTAEDAQWLESRKYTRTEIAGMYRVPPHLIGDLEKASLKNVEHQSIEFTKYTMAPWFCRWEERLGLQLLSEHDRRRFFFEFLVDGLLRGDQKTRYQAYHTAILDGWMNRNEVRIRENLDPQPGLDEFLEPENMRTAGETPDDEEPEPEEEEQVA